MELAKQVRTMGATARERITGAGGATTLWWILRIAAAMCYIGHGAFGIIGKEAWLPFFGIAGIPESTAWTLMPLIGAVDIALGISVLLAPRRAVLLYMAVWAVWTASLRPLTGDSVFELLERAGNYGVPIAMLVLLGPARTTREMLGAVGTPSLAPERIERARLVLTWTTALLLIGHGALAAIVQKPLYVAHMAAIGLPPGAAVGAGWLEITLGIVVLAHPRPVLLLGIVTWKLATEMLFPVAGAPFWEFIERGGSYGAPLALALLVRHRSALVAGTRLASTTAAALVALCLIAPAADAQGSARARGEREPDSAVQGERLDGDSLVPALRRGGYVLFFRHTTTDHDASDRGPAREQQRNLTAEGEHEAREIGEAIRALGIPIGEVRASYMYRTRETAELAFGRVQIDSSLRGSDARDGALAQLVAPVARGTNRVVLTHSGTMTGVLRGHGVGRIAEGDIVVIEPIGGGEFRVVAHVTRHDWRRLASSGGPAPAEEDSA